jgi:hypothetical protein
MEAYCNRLRADAVQLCAIAAELCTDAGALVTEMRDQRERLRREWNGSRFGERAGELGEDRQVGVQPNAVQSTDAERRERPLMLEAAELPLDGGAATVEGGEAGRVARDQWEQALGLDPD